MKHLKKIFFIIVVCFVNVLLMRNTLAQVNLGINKDETAPLITSEFTSFVPGSGYCRFIPTTEYDITISSDCAIFDLYLPDGPQIRVECGAFLNIQMGYNQTHFVYFENVGENVILKITTSGSLPVELTSFSANVNENKVVLNWQTATEVNNYGFEIERQTVETLRATSNKWETICFVEGHGNSNSPKDYTFTDNLLNLNLGLSLNYRLKQIDFDGNYEYSDVVEVTLAENIKAYKLEQNFPNPFNPSTTIKYSIPRSTELHSVLPTTLKVYDILGNEVATLVNEKKNAGNYEVKFNASNLASGIYLYKLQSGSFIQTRKLMLIK